MPYEDYQRWKTTPIDGQPYLSIVIPGNSFMQRAESSFIPELAQ